MKTKVLLMFCVILITGCTNQTPKPLTDSDKEAIVESVKKVSQEFWTAFGQTYDNETYSKIRKYFDENSDLIWQTDPVAFIANTSITYKQTDWQKQLETIIRSRISCPCTVSDSHYSVFTDKKVLEVINGNGTIIGKDSIVVGPLKFINTGIWANIDGEWKMQFMHQSFEPH